MLLLSTISSERIILINRGEVIETHSGVPVVADESALGAGRVRIEVRQRNLIVIIEGRPPEIQSQIPDEIIEK